MKKLRHYHRRFRLSFIKAGLIALVICAFLLPSYIEYQSTGENFFTIIVNGEVVGYVDSEDKAQNYLLKARKQIASRSQDLIFLEANMEVIGEENLTGKTDRESEIVNHMIQVLEKGIQETLNRSYTVKINEISFNLGSYEEVRELLVAALSPYDTEGLYQVDLVQDKAREVNVLVPEISMKALVQETQEISLNAGVEYVLNDMIHSIEDSGEKDFDDYVQGLISIEYAETIEVVEAYLPENRLTTVERAVNLVTKEQETQVIYKVQSGDTLSKIALENNIPLDELIANNDALEDENSMIRVDQELVITVPEPDLSIIYQVEEVVEEYYDAPVEYIPNDSWYTTTRKTLQEPSAGSRKVVAVTTYENGKAVNRDILKEVVYMEAVPKIVERGTKTPPTYIKPISGGRLSSSFGSRTSPTKGASSNHKGVDWATPTGTPVVASNGGTVVTAGWVSGYGYAVYINHDDGRQTRYGHLSKVLVKAGQRVSQGQRIALSGNTGISTGPHLHFEIRINGVAVNPLKYLN